MASALLLAAMMARLEHGAAAQENLLEYFWMRIIRR
jgi:hypothetical protein